MLRLGGTAKNNMIVNKEPMLILLIVTAARGREEVSLSLEEGGFAKSI